MKEEDIQKTGKLPVSKVSLKLAMRKMYEDTGEMSRFHSASRQFGKLTNLQGFREWYDPATGKGYGADRQLWSATLFSRAYLNLRQG